MVFSTSFFLFAFFPLVLILYFVVPSIERKNTVLLVFSILFYAWGEPIYVLLLIGSIVLNWTFGRHVAQGNPNRKQWLIISIVTNVMILFVFKYLGFLCEILNKLFGSWLLKTPVDISLPIGISFFTFQAISYVLDVYRGHGEPQLKIKNVALYISFFPQLIAGPIVRYQTISTQIEHRVFSVEMIREGVRRFILGLGKKVIFADAFSLIADRVFGTDQSYGCLILWVGAIGYSLQILFDFSGYSDMAIGLGKIFGFEFQENFNYPYISKSITEFWRRWHISLGTWFRDYVYIPLGGNRVSNLRHIFNLFVVWLLTGLWHGANWTFLLWGLFYFVVLLIEKTLGLNKFFENKLHIIPHIYTMFFVVIGWVLFRSGSVAFACQYIVGMFGPVVKNAYEWTIMRMYIGEYGGLLLLSFLFLIPANRFISILVKKSRIYRAVSDVAYLCMFVLSVSYIMKGSYSPFIYFNF